MNVTTQDISNAMGNPLFWVCSIWIAREVVNFVKSRHSELTLAIENLTKQMLKLESSIEKLEIKLEATQKIMLSIPKMQKDIDSAHDKIREKRIEQ